VKKRVFKKGFHFVALGLRHFSKYHNYGNPALVALTSWL